jgi:hypothetical protein
MKLFIATPAFDGKVHVPYALSLSDTVMHLSTKNVPVMTLINVSGSLLCAERNRLLKAFLETDCTHILCIDSDLGWNPESVFTLLEKDVDVVVGCYPARQERIFLFRPAENEDKSLVVDFEKQLIKVEYVPAGFMLIKRDVIETMVHSFPETYFKPKDGKSPDGHALFNTEVREGEFWGEDYVFCRRIRECGFNIWADPQLMFNHAGVVGSLSEVLTDKRPEEQK